MPNESVDILFGGAYAIKSYYEESGNPKQMRGASQLLLDAFDVRIRTLVTPHLYNPKRFPYYTGGSQLFTVLKAGAGEDMLAHVEKTLYKCCQTARYSIINQRAYVEDLESERYCDLMDRLFAASYEKRMAYLPDFLLDDAEDDSVLLKDYVYKLSETSNTQQIEGKDYCERCRNRPAHYRVEVKTSGNIISDELSLCTACTKKEARGRLTLAERREGVHDITQMSDLEDSNGDVALLYADINNLGGIGASFKTYQERYKFHTSIDQAVRKALEITKKSIQKPYQEIACGGDDICMLLRGDQALFAAERLASAFDNTWAEQNHAIKEVHLSIGVTISNSKTSIDIFHKMTEQLVTSAKVMARCLKKDRCAQSCLDVFRLGGDGQYFTSLERLRDFSNPNHPWYIPNAKTRFSLFPMSRTQASTFASILEAAEKIAASRIRNIIDGSKQKSVLEGELYFQYLYARHHDDKHFEELINRIRCFPGMDAEKPRLYYRVYDELISPWHDLLTLKTQKAGGAHV